jgi:hypothetical protein
MINICGSENIIDSVVRFDDVRLGKILSCWTFEQTILCVIVDNDGNTFVRDIQNLVIMFKTILPKA